MPSTEFVYGKNPVLEALNSGRDIEKIYIDRTLKGDAEMEVRAKAKEREIPLSRIPANAFRKWTKQPHQGLLAVMSVVEYKDVSVLRTKLLEEVVDAVLILDHVKDVRNMGAIIRSALCFGVRDIVIPAKNSAEINNITVKASAGAVLKCNLYRVTNLPKTMLDLKDTGAQVISLDKKSGQSLTTFSPQRPYILVIGSEGHGVTKELLNKSDVKLAIDHKTEFDSLNVSVATGIALFHLTMQES
ncbi:MAG: 23S rRNA (guanosine(2251)-2'-O)-methyltransferase RlmB [Saprospiraceae bacterium]|nr:23S rRNA (guanosine(2251)-2'-O)-methyltransferase RlmB [Saprospiraceae bacterium]